MRREGYELQVSKPKVIYKELNGHKCEPIEMLVVDVPKQFEGAVMQAHRQSAGRIGEDGPEGEHDAHGVFDSARGLIGLRTRLLNATQGEAMMHHTFHDYQLLRGGLPGRQNGVMISMEMGSTNAYALDTLPERGMMFVKPGDEVYEGMVVGENNKDTDIRECLQGEEAVEHADDGRDKNIILKPPRDMSLEIALEYIEDDELVEITPKTIRLRKRWLKEKDRKRHGRSSESE